jgi:hypothetical protein
MTRNALILRLFMRLRPVALSARRVALALLAACGWWLVAAPRLNAHEIPQTATLIAYVKPDGNTLRVVARVPLAVMRDIQWPLRGPGYLELNKLDQHLRDGVKIWLADNLRIFENGTPVVGGAIRAVRVSLMSDRSFESYDAARASFIFPALPDTMDLAWQQAMVDVELNYQIASQESRFSIEPTHARLAVRMMTVLRFVLPDGEERVFTYAGDPGRVHLDPNFTQAGWQFVRLGFAHILDGIDHLLFVLLLVIPFRQVRPLLVIVTAFTIAHSMTMIASALGLGPSASWFPPLVEVLIAISIVYTAFENIVGAKIGRRWMLAFAFGLVHGFGFSFALRESLQFAGSHLAIALATFNVGVELGQVAVLVVAVPLLHWAFTRLVAEKVGAIILSALVAHTAWHWMLERGATLGEYSFSLGALDATAALELVRLAILAVLGAAIVWLLRPLARRLLGTGHSEPAPVRSSSPLTNSVDSQ